MSPTEDEQPSELERRSNWHGQENSVYFMMLRNSGNSLFVHDAEDKRVKKQEVRNRN